jgi:hypothetical protein
LKYQSVVLHACSVQAQPSRLLTRYMRRPVGWLLSLIFAATSGHIYADETPVFDDLQQREAADQAYEQAIVRFNTSIKEFNSWEAFKASVFSRIEHNAPGRCYELTASSIEPITIVNIAFHQTLDGTWKHTSDNGWRQLYQDRTFIEYRYNREVGTLLWIEGVNPRFFFASTRRLCEVPLSSQKGTGPSS